MHRIHFAMCCFRYLAGCFIIRSGVEVGEVCDQLEKHFKTIGAPVMIGELPLLLNGFEVKL